MSWPSFLTPGAAWLLLAAVPLVLLYFLRLKRPRLKVPSLVLWRQVLQDERVNSPFAKLKRNLLLLLQLILLLLLVLAAMQPFLPDSGVGKDRLLVLIDRSASMAALDRPGGTSRLAAAIEQVRQLVDGLDPKQEMGLIVFAGVARQASPFTSDKRLLRSALNRLEVEDQRADLGAALRMAAATAQVSEVGRVLLISDGNLPEAVGFDLPFDLDYRRVPEAGPNLGITALSAGRDTRGGWSLFARVEGTADATAPAVLRVLQDGEEVFEEPVVTVGGEEHRFVFPVRSDGRVSVEVTLQVEGFDSLASDNRALIELAPIRPVTVRVSPSLETHRRVLAVMQGVEFLAEDATDAPDLVITDRQQDLQATSAVGLLVGAVPEDLADLIETGEGGAAVVDWSRTDLLLDHAEMADLLVMDRVRWIGGAGEEDIERRGYEVIVHGDGGPLMLRRGSGYGGSDLYVMLFHSDRSTLPYRVGFPVMISNLIGIAMDAAGLREVEGLRAGVLPPFEVSRDGLSLRAPDGSVASVSVGEDGVARGMSAPKVGWYELVGSGERRRMGVNLLDGDETLLGSRDELFLSDLSVGVAERELATNRPFWFWLVLLALPVLLAEWWLFQRRNVGMTVVRV